MGIGRKWEWNSLYKMNARSLHNLGVSCQNNFASVCHLETVFITGCVSCSQPPVLSTMHFIGIMKYILPSNIFIPSITSQFLCLFLNNISIKHYRMIWIKTAKYENIANIICSVCTHNVFILACNYSSIGTHYGTMLAVIGYIYFYQKRKLVCILSTWILAKWAYIQMFVNKSKRFQIQPICIERPPGPKSLVEIWGTRTWLSLSYL